jgi:hypothetical protein
LSVEAWLPIVVGVWGLQLEEDVIAIAIAWMAEKNLQVSALSGQGRLRRRAHIDHG